MTSANEMIKQAAFDVEPGNTHSDKAVTVLVARAAIRQAKKEVFDQILEAFDEEGDTKFDNGKDFKGKCTNLETSKLFAKLYSIVDDMKNKHLDNK